MKGLYHLQIGQGKLMEALNLGKLQHLGHHQFEFAPFSTLYFFEARGILKLLPTPMMLLAW
jgi:hypothetical protein